MAAAAEAGRQHDFMRAMLVLKMGCQQWLEDYGGDTSGFIFKSVKDRKAVFSSPSKLLVLRRRAKRHGHPSVPPIPFGSRQEGSQSPAGAAKEFCVRARQCGKAKESGWDEWSSAQARSTLLARTGRNSKRPKRKNA